MAALRSLLNVYTPLVVTIMFFLAQPKPYSPLIIPIISFVICHPLFPVYFPSSILYYERIFALKKIFNHSHFTPSPTVCKFPSSPQTHYLQSKFVDAFIVLKNLMKNDNYNGSLCSQDNQWRVGFGLGAEKNIIVTTNKKFY